MMEKKIQRRSSLNVMCNPGTPVPMKKSSSIPSIAEKRNNINKLESEASEKETKDKKHISHRNDKSSSSLDLPPPCTCPYFGDKPSFLMKPTEVKIITTTNNTFLAPENHQHHHHHPPLHSPQHYQLQAHHEHRLSLSNNSISNNTTPTMSTNSLSIMQSPVRKLSFSKCNSIVTWDAKRYQRRGSSFRAGARTTLLIAPNKSALATSPLRRSVTLKHNNITQVVSSELKSPQKVPSSPCILGLQRNTTVRSHHSRNSSVTRNSSRHGRLIQLERKATKVLGIVFFTFVILWAPFFVINLLPTVCPDCEARISHWVFDFVTWLGYASSMVNPIFYTIFNKVFRQAFKKVLLCKYNKNKAIWRPIATSTISSAVPNR